MPLAAIAALAIALLGGAFLTYGRFVARHFQLDDSRETPACKVNDGNDFVPTRPPILLAQHFAAIAAAGPIVGPIAAGLAFGWAPALAWILFGCIFLGAFHDFASLVASMRHGARSVADLVREHMGGRAYALFLAFIWLSLVYVMIAFTDLTARSFVQNIVADETGAVKIEGIGGGVASSSFLYLLLAVAMGVVLRSGKVPLWLATAIFVPLLFGLIWFGQQVPLRLPDSLSESRQILAFDLAILAYCGVASMTPMWLLLQPRGYLGGFFLYATVGAGFLGMLLGGHHVQYPAYVGWTDAKGFPLFPMLFVTIACGACSGFHGLVCSGTTSKQVAKEGHARLVGYGGMLLEGFVAVMALATIMLWPKGSAALADAPSVIYARGISKFLGLFGVEERFGIAFGMLAFATFIYDTLDVCTRLGRYILQELTGWAGVRGRFAATLVTLAMPAAYIAFAPGILTVGGKAVPAWMLIWTVFGTSNQLLAGLTLLGIAVWLSRSRKSAAITLAAASFMLATTCASLALLARAGLAAWREEGRIDPNGAIALVLLGVALALVAEAARATWAASAAALPTPAADGSIPA